MHTNKYLAVIYVLFLQVCVVTAAAATPEKKLSHLFTLGANSQIELMLPSDVATGKKYAYVVDGGNNRVVVFDLKGQYLSTFGSPGKGKGELNYPVGIDVANDGKVYVADSGNKRIQVFDASGKYLSHFKVKSGRYLIRPIDVLVDEKNKQLYVTGNENHKVMVFSLKGKHKFEWGGNGVNEAEFRYPATLSFLKDGRVAVVDVLNSRVQIFERDGKYSFQIAGWGIVGGKVFRPKGVAVDNKGLVYISDSYLNVVQVFKDSGEFQYLLKLSDNEPLFTPVGMTVDSMQQLYITEMRRNRVRVYRLRQ